MCWRCLPARDGQLRLSRRSFTTGVLSASVAQSIDPSCLPAARDDLMEPHMSMAIPPGTVRTVALTLDACSGAADMRIIDTLLGLSVPATIFVTGLWLHANSPTLERLRARPDLFTLQNHGELHLPAILGNHRVYGLPVAGTLDAIHREVERGADAVAATGAPRAKWYRAAAALYSPAAISAIEAMDVRIAGFSLGADEGASLPAASVARRIAAAVSGDVIIAHVNQPHRPSGAGVAAGVTELHRSGTAFVGLDAFPMTALRCHPIATAAARV
nr:polysaccharide deacetylase family protein [uncultured Rhodopila sp.]